MQSFWLYYYKFITTTITFGKLQPMDRKKKTSVENVAHEFSTKRANLRRELWTLAAVRQLHNNAKCRCRRAPAVVVVEQSTRRNTFQHIKIQIE